MEIVLATCNLHKLREFREMFRPFAHLELISLHSFSDYVPPEETADTFKGNALIKAEHAANYTKKWVLADDSGLVVPALQGKPGVRSKRYAGAHATDEDNRNKLLEEMRGLEEQDRSAYYECSLVIVGPARQTKFAQGICEGHICKEARGNHGFGYDSLFLKNDYQQTFGQLSEDIKNRISHRYKAFERFRTFLEALN